MDLTMRRNLRFAETGRKVFPVSYRLSLSPQRKKDPAVVDLAADSLFLLYNGDLVGKSHNHRMDRHSAYFEAMLKAADMRRKNR